MLVRLYVLSKIPQYHPLPSPPTVLSVFKEAIFSFYNGEIGKIEVLRKAAPFTSFLRWYLSGYISLFKPA